MRRVRIAVLALVAALAGYALLRPRIDDWLRKPVGMTETPCAANRGPVTGRPVDDWAGLCLYRESNRTVRAQPSRPRMVMMGDSITAQWPGLPGDIVNRGVSGQTSAQIMLRFRQDSVDLHPGAIHILAGINDTAGNSGPLSPDMFMANIRSMVELARASEIEPVLGTIPPVSDYDWKPGLDPKQWIAVLNRQLTDYARAENIVVADYHAAMTLPDGTRNAALYRDGVHPNMAGYAALRRVLDDTVARVDARLARRAERR
jgi:lysophospholipase L1-like esterase